MKPLITIGMPVYNVENYVGKALLSALNQTYDNLEIIVIDDKGTDNSMSVVKEIKNKHPKGNIIRIIDHKVNKGPGATRNTAMDEATGKYLFIMDSDDEITEDCIETLYTAMKETPVDFVVGSIDEVDDSGKLLLRREYIDVHLKTNEEILNSQYNPEWLKKGKSSRLIAPIWNKLYDLNFLRENDMRCIPNQKNEDMIFSFKLFIKANSTRILSRPTYKYNVDRIGSTMNEARKGYNEFRMKQDLDILEFYSSYIPQIKTRKKEISRQILYSILAFGCVLKFRVSGLVIDKDRYNKIIKRIRGNERISITDLPYNLKSIINLFYLFGPESFAKAWDKVFFEKRIVR